MVGRRKLVVHHTNRPNVAMGRSQTVQNRMVLSARPTTSPIISMGISTSIIPLPDNGDNGGGIIVVDDDDKGDDGNDVTRAPGPPPPVRAGELGGGTTPLPPRYDPVLPYPPTGNPQPTNQSITNIIIVIIIMMRRMIDNTKPTIW
jgi:hypothetical protein